MNVIARWLVISAISWLVSIKIIPASVAEYLMNTPELIRQFEITAAIGLTATLAALQPVIDAFIGMVKRFLALLAFKLNTMFK